MKVVALTCFSMAAAQQAGDLTKEVHPALPYSFCNSGGCKEHNAEVVIDANWRWTHVKGETTNCYTGNLWDESLCPDSKTCTANCVVDGADKEYNNTYGVNTKGSKLSLGFVTEGPYSTNIGSRVYLMQNEDEYKTFNLKNREFTFTVDDKEIGCGLNGALYFVQMEKDGGKKKHGNAGARYGTGYCDAQCPHDLKFINGEANNEDWVPSENDENAGTGKYGTCCTEIDLWEANSISTAFTMHACDHQNYKCHGTSCGDNGEDRFSGVCDKNGCDIQNIRFNGLDSKFYGPGKEFTIDSLKPVTVTTQFLTNDGTDSGTINEVKQFYTQNGKTIEHPMYSVNGKKHNSITDDFCKDWVSVTKDGTNFIEKGGMKAVDDAFEAGSVLVMSLWDDHYANMLWLDSIYPTSVKPTECDKYPGSCRGTCPITSGVPADVESGESAGSTIHFWDIKYGKIGTTVEKSDSITV
jgi:cellulose 1,4-beta-cellobiosidase